MPKRDLPPRGPGQRRPWAMKRRASIRTAKRWIISGALPVIHTLPHTRCSVTQVSRNECLTGPGESLFINLKFGVRAWARHVKRAVFHQVTRAVSSGVNRLSGDGEAVSGVPPCGHRSIVNGALTLYLVFAPKLHTR